MYLALWDFVWLCVVKREDVKREFALLGDFSRFTFHESR